MIPYNELFLCLCKAFTLWQWYEYDKDRYLEGMVILVVNDASALYSYNRCLCHFVIFWCTKSHLIWPLHTAVNFQTERKWRHFNILSVRISSSRNCLKHAISEHLTIRLGNLFIINVLRLFFKFLKSMFCARVFYT